MKKVLSTLAAFGFIAAASPALADNHENRETGFYAGISGGYTFLEDQDATETAVATGAQTPFKVDFGGSWSGLASIGYNFGGVRIEVEGGYRNNDIDTLSVGAFGVAGVSLNVDGDLTTKSGMANAIVDLPIEGPLTPFLVGGVGFANHEVDVSRIAATAVNFKDDDTVFAYQIGAGLAYEIGDKAALTMQYRWMGSEDYNIGDATATDEVEYDSHTVMVGLRFGF